MAVNGRGLGVLDYVVVRVAASLMLIVWEVLAVA